MIRTDIPIPTVSELPDVVANLTSDDKTRQMHGATALRQFLNTGCESGPPQVAALGVLPRLVELLQTSSTDLIQLQYDIALALTNVAAGTHECTAQVVAAGAVPCLITLLRSPNELVRGQAAWALGNVAGDSCEFRDLVISMDAVPLLIDCFSDDPLSVSDLVRSASWTLSNCFRGTPSPPLALAQTALEAAKRLIRSEDVEVVADTCWLLAHLCGGDHAQAVIDSGLVPLLHSLVSDHRLTSQPAILCIKSIVTIEIAAQKIPDLNLLHSLAQEIDSEGGGKINLSATCELMAVITGGNHAQIQAVFNCGIVPSLMSLLESSPSYVKPSACLALTNILKGGTSKQISELTERGIFAMLIDTWLKSNSDTATLAFDAIDAVFRRADERLLGALGEHTRYLFLAHIGACERFDVQFRDKAYAALTRALFVLERARMTQICIGLQELGLPALVTVTILDHTNEFVELSPWGSKWALVARVKHFKRAVA